MNSYPRVVLGIVLILIITVCATFLISRWTQNVGRVDMTADSRYTLTEGTESIISSLREPLTMKLFYAKELITKTGQDRLLEYNNYYYYVRDLLRSYERSSDGRLTLEEYDPRPFSDAEAEADRLRIQRIPVMENAAFYFGLAVTSKSGGQQVVPFFDFSQQSQVEYKVSEAIELASQPKKTKLGIVSSLDITGGGMTPMMRQMMQMQGRPVTQPWGMSELLQKSYEVVDIDKETAEIADDLDYLMVVHPKNFSDKLLYSIDQFVMRGGKTMVFVDPACFFGDRAPQNPQNPMGGSNHDSSSELNRLTEAWGLRLAQGKLVGDMQLAERVGGGPRGGAIRFVGTVKMDSSTNPDVIDQDAALTQGLSGALMFWFPGLLEKTDVEGVEVQPLLRTTPAGNTWTASSQELTGSPMTGGPDPARLNQKFSPGATPLMMAALATGKFKSAFPDGAPKEPEEGEPEDGETEDEPTEDEPAADTHVAECEASNTVLVVADVDLLTDEASIQRMMGMIAMKNSNPNLVLNAVEYMAGSSDLIGIRSRSDFRRPFTVVDEIEKEADMQTQVEVQKINDEIQTFRTQLSELQSQATTKNVGLLNSESLDKQRDIEAQIRTQEKRLRDVQKDKLSSIEALQGNVKFFNRSLIPFGVLLIGFALFVIRYSKRNQSMAKGGAV